MARRRSGPTVPRAMAVKDELPWVYGAARAASASEDAAAGATAGALAAGAAPRGDLVARAIRLAVAGDPASPFAGLEPEAREALALVRLGGLKVDEVAAFTGVGAGEVKRRLAAALTALRSGTSQRTPPLPPGFAS
jgi:DNA-directed RNA polymerase specialized sigma24 family protein